MPVDRSAPVHAARHVNARRPREEGGLVGTEGVEHPRPMNLKARYDYDVAVLGGGSAGYAAARTSAAAGLRTVVVEAGEELGGLCILRGCMPTKALLYAAEVMHLVTHARPWGIDAGKVRFDFADVMRRKDALVREFADDRARQLRHGPFQLLRARARFVDPHTVALQPIPPAARDDGPGGGKRGRRKARAGGATVPTQLTAANFVIATGSSVAPPPLPQLRRIDYLDSDNVLRLIRPPRSLIVLGGGSVALEFAQFFTRFRVPVTVIQRSEHVLHEFDADAAAVIENVLQREGVELFTGTTLTDFSQNGSRKEVTFRHRGKNRHVSAEAVLFALGRVANTSSLALDRAGVRTEGDRIVSDDRMQTSVPHIYAAGDCTGPHEIVHLAVLQGEVAAHNIAHPAAPRRLDDRLLTVVVFTEPQLAYVGLTEREARARAIPYRAATHPFNDHGKSLIMEAKDGFVKLLADPGTGKILGGACVGPAGGELIHEIIVAMSRHLTAAELAAVPHYHPTLAEIWTYPAEELAAQVAG
jgi:pyruvate/2-oxoglutarate dehydrogenase complex dihydrolipoamide dehydrogenase (E3) component